MAHTNKLLCNKSLFDKRGRASMNLVKSQYLRMMRDFGAARLSPVHPEREREKERNDLLNEDCHDGRERMGCGMLEYESVC